MALGQDTVAMINVSQGWVVLGDGTTLPITDYFDGTGDDCDPEEATVIVAGTDAFGWLTIEIEDERPTMQ